jgi:uncharacterized protein YecE (DUF72 family)
VASLQVWPGDGHPYWPLKRGRIAAHLHIGTSGWHYKHWKENFYPADLPTAQYLKWYVRHFKTVEINNCFYRLPAESAVIGWREQSPQDFCFAIKGSRFITHLKRLLEPEAAVKTYLDRMELLGPKLGPILFQLPPNWHVNLERLEAFLEALPPKKHQYVFEFRDPSWYTEAVYRLLRRHQAALCLHDWRGEKSPQELTAPFSYIRFHGATGKYQGNYTPEMLESWAQSIREWQRQLRDIYVYFNNDVGGYAVQNALQLENLLASAATPKLCA